MTAATSAFPASVMFGEGVAQIGGFVLSPDGRLDTLRWAPPPATREEGEGEGLGVDGPSFSASVIHYHVPPRSQAFLAPFVKETLRVPPPAGVTVLLMRPDGGRRVLGAYDVTAYGSGSFEGPDTVVELTLRRRVDAPPSKPIPSDSVRRPSSSLLPLGPCAAVSSSLFSGDPPPTPPPHYSPATLEERFAALWSAWKLDVVWRGREPSGGFPFAFSAAAVLFNVLAPRAVEWCGPGNRYGASCVVWDLGAEYPERGPFAAAKGCAILHRIPVVLCYGVPDAAGGSVENNCGIQTVLFRPGAGESTRAHFRITQEEGAVGAAVIALTIGELSDE